MEKNKWVEYRMKRILLTGLVIGCVCGGVVVSFFFRLTNSGDEKASVVETVKQVEDQDSNKEEKPEEKQEEKEPEAKQETWNLVLVNGTHPLDTAYAPELVEVEEGRLVDKRIAEDLAQMLADARAEGLSPYICSAYRDYQYQRKVFNETMVTWINQGYTPLDAYDETAKSVAIPGTSEHATGLALDITSATFGELDERQAETDEAKWLAKNCWKYGFILRYPPDKSDITGIIYEPWHYRYVGMEAAKEIMEQGMTLEEYLEK